MFYGPTRNRSHYVLRLKQEATVASLDGKSKNERPGSQLRPPQCPHSRAAAPARQERNLRETSIVLPCIHLDLLALLDLLLELKLGATITVGSTTSSTTATRASSSSAPRATSTTGWTPIG